MFGDDSMSAGDEERQDVTDCVLMLTGNSERAAMTGINMEAHCLAMKTRGNRLQIVYVHAPGVYGTQANNICLELSRQQCFHQAFRTTQLSPRSPHRYSR